MAEKFSQYYSTIKSFVANGLRLYFRNRQVVGYEENGRGKGALLFAANHQNTFLDPILIGAFTEKYRQVSYITRADVFQNKYADAFFRSIKMVPIYRQRDSGTRSRQLNEQAFKVYTERLGREEGMIIFPEGNHAREYRLRPLKKGLPRIVMQTFEEYGRDLPFSIVPVGVNYKHHDKYRTDVLVMYGPPIQASDYLALHDEHPQKALIAMRDDMQAEMEKLLIHIKADQYETVNPLRLMLGGDAAEELGLDPDEPLGRFRGEKQVIAAAEGAAETPEFATLTEEVATYQEKLEAANVRDHTVAGGPYSLGHILGQGLGALLGLPIFLLGFLTHLPIYLAAREIPRRMIKDHEFHAAIQFGVGLLLTPLVYLIFGIILMATLGLWPGLTATLALFPLGYFVKPYTDFVKKLRGKLRYMSLLRKGDNSLAELRTSIKAKVWKWKATETLSTPS